LNNNLRETLQFYNDCSDFLFLPISNEHVKYLGKLNNYGVHACSGRNSGSAANKIEQSGIAT